MAQVDQQPQPQQIAPQVIVVQQPIIGGAPMGGAKREWSTGICGCFSDIGSCCMGMFCMPYYMCMVSGKMGECCCAAHVALPALRTKLRTEQGIQGGVCEDWLCSNIFPHLIVCQLDRELKHIGR